MCLLVAAVAVHVTVEQASPIGLVVNELLLNAAKHGRSSSGACRVAVELERHDRQVHIWVRDDGPGFDLARVDAGSMGQTLIRALCRQLRAEINYAAAQGTAGTIVRLSFAHDDAA